ncbi:MAG: hypothetical protein M3133_09000 [Actinomycetota bacterium]|nr:hypothetical protein [Actinomycetota bacterium]
MTGGPVVLMDVPSLPDAFRERWWLPSRDMLDAVVASRAEVKVLAVELEENGGADPWSRHPVWVKVEERDPERFAGRITASTLDREGFREGDRLAAPLDRRFDFAVLTERGDAQLNEDRARFAMGKRVLVGLTILSADGELLEQREFAGRLVTVEPPRGLELELDDGTSYWLPPDVRPLEEAAPGDYRLRSTGAIERDPDYLCTWTVTRHDHSQPPSENDS